MKELNKYRQILKAEQKLEAKLAERQMRATYQQIELRKAQLAAAEENLFTVRGSKKPFSPEHRAAGDQFVAAWLQMFDTPQKTTVSNRGSADYIAKFSICDLVG